MEVMSSMMKKITTAFIPQRYAARFAFMGIFWRTSEESKATTSHENEKSYKHSTRPILPHYYC
jgi:hypothetical protein